jgi:predicted amidophosphoribosyltransferase
MNDGLGDAAVDLRAEAATPDAAQASPVCPSCGMKLPPFRPAERCPVCQLRAVLDAEEGVRVVKEFPETLESTIP